MTDTRMDASRILSIDLCNRGVGFVVFETPSRLVDWGVKQASRSKPNQALSHVRDLISLYRPNVVCLEDWVDKSCRRGARTRQLLAAIAALAKARHIPVSAVPITQVKKVFAGNGAFTKAQIAAAVALRFPPLIRRLPPLRKPWMSEDSRFSIFDAAAFALTYTHKRGIAEDSFD